MNHMVLSEEDPTDLLVRRWVRRDGRWAKCDGRLGAGVGKNDWLIALTDLIYAGREFAVGHSSRCW